MSTSFNGHSHALKHAHPPTEDGGATAPSPPSSAPRMFGDFRLVREVGRGGMGVVYEAWQISLSRRVALKVLSHGLGDARRHRRFEREAKAAGRLHHTNIVPVFGAGECAGTPYYIMQLIPGVGLDELLDETRRRTGRLASTEELSSSAPWPSDPGWADGPEHFDPTELDQSAGGSCEEPPGDEDEGRAPPPPDASFVAAGPGRWKAIARLGLQAASGLEYAHSQEILHRDVKPSNLLLDERGTLWVTDFGLAKWSNHPDSTVSGNVVGTLRYMPPEALDGAYDRTGDVYGLGLTLYELLTGRPAYDERDHARLIRQVTEATPTPLRKLNPAIPLDLATVVHKAMEKLPRDRYQSAAEFGDDLKRFLDDRPVLARRVSPSERYWRWARRNPVVAALGGVLTAVLILATLGSLLAARRFHDQAVAQRLLAEEREAGRREAEKAHEEEAEARRTAVAALRDARAAQEDKDRTLYDTRSNLAAAAWQADDYAQYEGLLDLMRPGPGDVDHRGWEWRYLRGLEHEGRLTIQSPGERFASVAVHPQGDSFITLDLDGTMRIREAADGREIRAIRPPDWDGRLSDLRFGVHEVAYSPDGTLLAGAGPGGAIGIYRIRDGALLRRLGEGRNPALSLAWSGDGSRLAASFASHVVRVWDVATGEEGPRFPGGHDGPVSAVALSPDGLTAATAGLEGMVKIWRLGVKPSLVHTLIGHEGEVRAAAFSPDGARLASAGLDGSIRIWDVETGLPRTLIRAQQGGVLSLAYPRAGGWIASGGNDNAVRVWDAESGRMIHSFLGHLDGVRGVAASPDGQVLISVAFDGIARSWNLQAPSRPRTFREPSLLSYGGVASCVAVSPDGRLLASGHFDHVIRIWDLATGQLLRHLVGEATKIRALDFSPDGRRLVSCEGAPDAPRERRGVAKVWDVAEWKPIRTYSGHGDVIDDVVFVDGGSKVASGGGRGEVHVWEVEAETPPMVLKGHEKNVRHLALTRDRLTLASGSDDGTVQLWDLSSGSRKATLVAGDDVLALAFSEDGVTLAVAVRNNQIRLWEIGDPEASRQLEGHVGDVLCLAFTPDGRLASGGADKSIRVWDTVGGRTILILKEHASAVTGLKVSRDGGLLASCGLDHAVQVWEAPPDLRPDAHVMMKR